MSKYLVDFLVTGCVLIEVDANSEEEALSIARERADKATIFDIKDMEIAKCDRVIKVE